MKKYVKIQSSVNITVTSGLQYEDVTNTQVQVADRLKIAARWPKLNVAIKMGTNWYPGQIAEWATVKALNEQGVLTIGEFADEVKDAEVERVTNNLNRAEKELAAKVKSIGQINLSDIAEE